MFWSYQPFKSGLATNLGRWPAVDFAAVQDCHLEGAGIHAGGEDHLRRLPQGGQEDDREVHAEGNAAEELRARLRRHDEAPATLLPQRTSPGQVARESPFCILSYYLYSFVNFTQVEWSWSVGLIFMVLDFGP